MLESEGMHPDFGGSTFGPHGGQIRKGGGLIVLAKLLHDLGNEDAVFSCHCLPFWNDGTRSGVAAIHPSTDPNHTTRPLQIVNAATIVKESDRG